MTACVTRFLVLSLALAAVACGGSHEGAFDKPNANATYWRDVKPILAHRCEGCHDAGGIGPFDLTSYASAKAQGPAIKGAVDTRVMPPWMLSPGLPFRHERRLTDDEIAKIDQWVETGMAEGAPEDMPAPSTSDIDVIEPAAELKMEAAYKPDLSLGDDDYRCFVLDPELAKDVAVTGFDIRPGNRRIVHHVILYNVEPDTLTDLAREDAADPGVGYTCFGTANVDALMLGAWVPGITATRFPEGTGVVLKKGSKIVMQVHYNTLEDKQGTDQTTAQLEYAEASDVKGAYIFPVLNDSFRVDPGEVKTVTEVFNTDSLYRYIPAGVNVQLHGVAPHMHLHGKSLKVTMTDANGAATNLVEVPKWDFHWQQLYFYEESVTLPRHGQVKLECTFDNRALAQPYVNGQQLEPKTLEWGEGTLQEMCLNFFYATF